MAAKEAETHEVDCSDIAEILIGKNWKEQLLQETARDDTLQAIKRLVLIGWPKDSR